VRESPRVGSVFSFLFWVFAGVLLYICIINNVHRLDKFKLRCCF
jgi:hypothetical protein